MNSDTHYLQFIKYIIGNIKRSIFLYIYLCTGKYMETNSFVYLIDFSNFIRLIN